MVFGEWGAKSSRHRFFSSLATATARPRSIHSLARFAFSQKHYNKFYALKLNLCIHVHYNNADKLPDFSPHPDYQQLFDTRPKVLYCGLFSVLNQSREQATILLADLWSAQEDRQTSSYLSSRPAHSLSQRQQRSSGEGQRQLRQAKQGEPQQPLGVVWETYWLDREVRSDSPAIPAGDNTVILARLVQEDELIGRIVLRSW